MIIFYNKHTGQIVGTIDGRVHSKEQLGMWIGDLSETKRIICEWRARYTGKVRKVRDNKGNLKDEPIFEFYPERQADVFEKLEKNRGSVFNFEVDINTKLLKEKGK